MPLVLITLFIFSTMYTYQTNISWSLSLLSTLAARTSPMTRGEGMTGIMLRSWTTELCCEHRPRQPTSDYEINCMLPKMTSFLSGLVTVVVSQRNNPSWWASKRQSKSRAY